MGDVLTLPEQAPARPTHDSIVLRPYQGEAIRRILGEFARGVPSTLLILPTGTGKTVTFGQLASMMVEEGQRVLVLAHREELLDQAARSLAWVGVPRAVEKAARKVQPWSDPGCVVASVATMQGRRLQSWPAGYFSLVITDEAHHATAASYRRIYDHLQPRWHLGVTATADRFDKANLGDVFGSLAFEYSLRDAVLAGYLARLLIVRCETSVDLSAIRTTGGDLNQADVEEAIRPHIEELVNATIKEIGDRPAIVFTPDVGSAQATASALGSLGVPAAAIAGDSPDRAAILDDFRAGRTRVLCNCNLLTEGYDAPFVSAIVLMRPTKSRSLYGQMVGRGTRLSPGKEDCLIVDFAWLTGRHKLVNPVELLSTTKGPAVADPETAAVVAEMLVQERLDLLAAIERADGLVEERRRIRVAARKKEVHYRRVAYDPFGQFQALGFPTEPESEEAMRQPPTERQLAMLEKAGISHPDRMSRERASEYIQRIITRREKGLATLRQVKFLVRLGVPSAEADARSCEAAQQHLSRLQVGRRH